MSESRTRSILSLRRSAVAAGTHTIDFKLCVIVHQAVTGRAPSYLCSLLTFVADRPGRVSLRSASRRDLDVPRTRLKFGA